MDTTKKELEETLNEAIKFITDRIEYAGRQKHPNWEDTTLTILTKYRDGQLVGIPSIDDAGVIALNVLSSMPKLKADEEAFFIAGFQECIKYLTTTSTKQTEKP
jgi:hypothetical protein